MKRDPPLACNADMIVDNATRASSCFGRLRRGDV
jgi:hypothetical protein